VKRNLKMMKMMKNFWNHLMTENCYLKSYTKGTTEFSLRYRTYVPYKAQIFNNNNTVHYHAECSVYEYTVCTSLFTQYVTVHTSCMYVVHKYKHTSMYSVYIRVCLRIQLIHNIHTVNKWPPKQIINS
jgi:hypothetical protein